MTYPSNKFDLIDEAINKNVIETLPKRELIVIKARRAGRTLDDIGVEIGRVKDPRHPVSRERVRAIEAKALRRLKGRLAKLEASHE